MNGGRGYPGSSVSQGDKAAAGDHTWAVRPLFDDPLDLILCAGFVVIVVVMFGVWVTGQVAGVLFCWAWPDTPIDQGVSIVMRLPGTWSDPRQAWPASARSSLPGLVGMLYSAVLVVLASTGAAVGLWAWAGARRQIRGWASAAQIRDALSGQAALARVGTLRPGLSGRAPVRDPHEVAVDLGKTARERVMVAVDEGVVMVAPPRMGKTSQVIIPWLTDWPGPAIVTSVRTDIVFQTMSVRKEKGAAVVMDLSGTRWPAPLRWSPTSGCERFDAARRRAETMVTVGRPETGGGDSTNSGFFGQTAINLLAGWLHAAALTGRSMGDVLSWALDERQDECIRLLRDHPRAAPGVAALLDGIYRSPAETRSNMWSTVSTAVAPLLSDNARATFSPEPGDSLDVEAFLAGAGGAGTLYLLVPEQEARMLAPLITSFVDEIVRTATRFAASAPTGRLDPPLGLFLDEIANVVPLPQLPQLMSYAAGSGIFIAAIFQDLAQARERWGRDGADMIWASATCKVALGGLSGDEMSEFSRLAGKYREIITSVQHGGPHGPTYQTSLQDRDVISPDRVRLMSRDERLALIIYSTLPAVMTRMQRHYEGPHAHEHRRSDAETRTALASAEKAR